MIQGHQAAFKATHYRSIFLSDFHMGSRAFDASALLDFLKSVECDHLFLVGDIIDGWKLGKRWFWNDDYSAILDELSRKSQEHGTKITYLPGNHDTELRRLMPLSRGRFAKKLNIKIKNKVIHTLADGRQFLVLHGDQFDHRILHGTLPKWTNQAYKTIATLLNRTKTQQRTSKKNRFSLAKALANNGKLAPYIINNFEHAIYNTAQSQEVDGLICGHTHIPALKTIKDITYANAGSWVGKNHTALIEHHDGHLELIEKQSSHCTQIHMDTLTPMQSISCRIIPDASAYRPTTDIIIKKIQDIWPVQPLQPTTQNKPSFPFFHTNWAKEQKKPILPLLSWLKNKYGTYTTS